MSAELKEGSSLYMSVSTAAFIKVPTISKQSKVKVVVILILCLLGNIRICESKSMIQLNV